MPDSSIWHVAVTHNTIISQEDREYAYRSLQVFLWWSRVAKRIAPSIRNSLSALDPGSPSSRTWTWLRQAHKHKTCRRAGVCVLCAPVRNRTSITNSASSRPIR